MYLKFDEIVPIVFILWKKMKTTTNEKACWTPRARSCCYVPLAAATKSLRGGGGILCSERGQSRDAFQAIPLEETSPRCNRMPSCESSVRCSTDFCDRTLLKRTIDVHIMHLKEKVNPPSGPTSKASIRVLYVPAQAPTRNHPLCLLREAEPPLLHIRIRTYNIRCTLEHAIHYATIQVSNPHLNRRVRHAQRQGGPFLFHSVSPWEETL